MRAADEIVEVADEALIAAAGAGRCQVGGGAAVKTRELIQLLRRKTLEAGTVARVNQLHQPGPSLLSILGAGAMSAGGRLHGAGPFPERLR